MPQQTDDEPRVYEIVLTERAEGEIDQACFAMAPRTSPDFAVRWRDGIMQAVHNLELFPQSHPISETESFLFQVEVRRMRYQLGRLAYRVFFTLIDADLDGTADTVRVLHVRHASRE